MAKADVLLRIRDNLYSSRAAEHPFIQEISAIANNTITTITAVDGTVWEAGDILEVEETGELCYVRSVATNTLTVIRGFNGTTAAATTDTVPLVRKNPRFTQIDIERQFDRVLASLWGHGIWCWTSTSKNIAAGDTLPWLFQLTGTVTPQPKDVVALIGTSTFDNAPEVHIPFHVRGTASAVEVRAWDPGNLDYDTDIYLIWVKPITNIDTDEIHPDVEQVLEDGVTYRLLASTMGSRGHDPGQLTDRTIQAGQGGRDARFYQGEFVLGIRRIAQSLKVELAERRVGQDYRTSRNRRWRV